MAVTPTYNAFATARSVPLPLSGISRVAVAFLTYTHHKNPPSRMIAKRVGATIAAVGGPLADASTVVEVLVLVLVLVVLVVLIIIGVVVVLLAVVVVALVVVDIVVVFVVVKVVVVVLLAEVVLVDVVDVELVDDTVEVVVVVKVVVDDVDVDTHGSAPDPNHTQLSSKVFLNSQVNFVGYVEHALLRHLFPQQWPLQFVAQLPCVLLQPNAHQSDVHIRPQP